MFSDVFTEIYPFWVVTLKLNVRIAIMMAMLVFLDSCSYSGGCAIIAIISVLLPTLQRRPGLRLGRPHVRLGREARIVSSIFLGGECQNAGFQDVWNLGGLRL